MISFAEVLNTTCSTTPGLSLFTNGLNERNHGIFQAMRYKMMKENPEVSRKEALFWCWIAKNALQMVESCSSSQLFFGRNPCLPTLADDLPPAIVKKPKSQSLAEMLAGQVAAGKAFREVQADKAIRKALSSNIRVQGRRMKMGESVCSWRLGDSGW